MKTKKGKKIAAVVMALLMIIGIMPMDWAVKSIGAAEPKTYSFDATTLTAAADKEVIAAGTGVDAEGYIKTFGDVQKRTSSSGSVSSTEIGKIGASGYTFTVTGTADVSFVTSSTGGSNTSEIALTNEAGETVANNEGVTQVTGSADNKATLTYTGLAAGTYKIVCPGNARGARIYSISVTEIPVSQTKTYEFDSATLTAAADKEVIAAGTGVDADGYIKTFGDVQKRTSSSGSVSSTEIGKIGASGYTFTVTGTADVSFVTSSTGGSNTSEIALTNEAGETVANNEGVTEVTGSADKKVTLTYTGLAAGTYKIICPGSARGARIYVVSVTETSSGERPARAEWSAVAAPAIGEITSADGKITVPYTMVVGYDGADNVTVTMKNSAGVEVKSITSDKTDGSVEFAPDATGNYTFAIKAARADEADKTGADKAFEGFVLPLATPSFSSATSQGNGSIGLVWNSVKEATSYEVSYSSDGTNFSAPVSVVGTEHTVSGLTVGTEYTFKLTAVRSNPAATTESVTITATVTAEAQVVWSFSAFGDGVSTSKNGFSGSANDGEVTVWGWGGKIVPASVDGLSFYYTSVPSTLNFTLSATVSVDKWTLSNGQEGFGMMACDRVGENGVSNSSFWNNSYMNTVTKVEYFADAEGNVTDDTTANKISMKLGIGSQEKSGVTKENLPKLEAKDTETVNNEFSSKMTTLETSCAAMGAGTYNIVGNATAAVPGTVENAMTEYRMTIQKNNTGYFISYTDEAGNTITKKYYDTEALEKLDEDNVYVGFFASRNAQITVKDIDISTISPEEDAPKEEQPITQVTPSYTVTSGTVANGDSYKFTYVSNADGHVVIKDADGKVVADQDVVADEKISFNTTLTLGKNPYTVVATPDEGYKPSEFEELSSYEAVTFTHTVTYDNFSGDVIYVGPEGTSSGIGTKENPVDIYTAVKYVKPGQYIIVLGGTYNLESTVKIERGIDGTADALIKMIREPGTSEDERPVFDFGGNCEGMVIAGNYWHIQGIDVTNSANGKDGIRLSGSHVIMDNVRTYHNGNTGLQISRYLTSDKWDDWPANNLVLNCTSYGNADAGYEDADGFAAKLTIADGNVFDGCIAYNNADDGWDLFAKVETGSIGTVTIQNCVAYGNGYLEDGTNAGNGNGFKLGGSSMSGYHKLINSVSFDNKAKGIDSNSCPDIQVTDCTSFNNGSNNVALYTNDAANTDFMATGVLSYRTQFTDIAENFKLRGTQDQSKVYQDTNYFWNYTPVSKAVGDAHNSAVEVTADWVKSLNTYMDYTTHIYSQRPISRNANGTINMNDLLVLTSVAKAGAVVAGQETVAFSLNGLSTTSGLVAPKTGDTTTATPFILLGILSVAIVAGVYFFDKKKKKIVRK